MFLLPPGPCGVVPLAAHHHATLSPVLAQRLSTCQSHPTREQKPRRPGDPHNTLNRAAPPVCSQGLRHRHPEHPEGRSRRSAPGRGAQEACVWDPGRGCTPGVHVTWGPGACLGLPQKKGEYCSQVLSVHQGRPTAARESHRATWVPACSLIHGRMTRPVIMAQCMPQTWPSVGP